VSGPFLPGALVDHLTDERVVPPPDEGVVRRAVQQAADVIRDMRPGTTLVVRRHERRGPSDALFTFTIREHT
jgi:hypothetical protein